MTDLPKTFDPAAIERRWYAHWEEAGLFRPERPGAQPFTIVMPPPNVTGSLHIGHALDVTLQDILVRHARLKGRDALWVVGTDHAGIATQMVVERQMNAAGEKRTDLTREQFVERVWTWKAESGGAITRQLRRLGASCDWATEQFTMDPHFSRAVTKVFVDFYNKGLIYRDKRLVNWDPGLKTAISDLEVETREEVQGKFWHLAYPLADGSGMIQVATTRPETMLADMAVAVHPDDERYRVLVGKMVRLPITGREIPIVADEHADPELGSGAVKITPGHDFNDFEVGVRAGFKAVEMLNMLDADAKVVQCGGIPDDLIGLDRFAARAAVVARLEADGALVSVEDRVIQTPYGDRSGVVIEPWLTDQWYVDAKTLAGPAIEAVRSGAIEVIPPTWKKTWDHWLENIQPWCVSRQLWWGHRIPAWSSAGSVSTGEPGRVYVAESEAEAIVLAATDAGSRQVIVFETWDDAFDGDREGPWAGQEDVYALVRDPDVLDTWFSSALWPFATLGWPDDQTPPPEGEGDRSAQPSGGGVITATGVVCGEVPLHQPSAGPPPLPGEECLSLLAGRYPNDILISGFDILFFWDARMAMQGIELLGDVPFRKLYLHGLVRDATGAKMSKSKGNTVDPLGLIDRYGADALRFTLAAMESQGRDIKLDERRVEGYRNFATKLWNAARFAQANGIRASTTLEPPKAALAVNRWIVGETQKTVQALDLALADLRFDEAANTIYHFVWDRFCDWYLELIKPVLQPGDRAQASVRAEPVEAPSFNSEDEERARLRQAQPERDEADETRAVAGWVLDQILAMLHPFMPFITEELWHAMGARGSDLIAAAWPMADARAIDPEAAAEIEWLINLVREIRSARTEFNIPVSALTDLVVAADESRDGLRVRFRFDLEPKLKSFGPSFARLARIRNIHFAPVGSGFHAATAAPAIDDFVSKRSFQIVVDHVTYSVPLEGVIDLDAERARLARSRTIAEKERDALAARLANPSFVERAKPEAVEKARADHAEKAAEAERLGAALARLG